MNSYSQANDPSKDNSSAEASTRASPREKLDYSYKILLDSYNKYLDNVFKTIGFLVVIIGWLITSDKSRSFIEENRWVRNTFLLVVVVMWALHLGSLVDNYREGTRIIESIRALNYMGAEYFERYEPKLYKTIGSSVLDSALFILLFTIIYRLRAREQADT